MDEYIIQVLIVDWLINHTSKFNVYFGKFLQAAGKMKNRRVRGNMLR